MSLVLAIDTATDSGSVALGAPDDVRMEILLGGRRHAAHLVPAIHQLLAATGVGFADLSGVVVADGPGSFTGLRIGFATAQGVLRAHEHWSLWTAPSLVAATQVGRRLGYTTVAAVYDALRGEVFASVCAYQTGRLEVVLPPVLIAPDALTRSAAADAALGDGAVAHAAAMRAWTGEAPLPLAAAGPRASALIELMQWDGGVARVPDPFAYEPAYGRKAEAQVKWERTHGQPLPDSQRTRG